MSGLTGLSKHRHRLVPVTVFTVLLALGGIYRHDLSVWFSGGRPPSAGPDEAAPPRVDHSAHGGGAVTFDDDALAHLREALSSYEQIRIALAHDHTKDVQGHAATIQQALATAAARTGLKADLVRALEEAGRTAEKLRHATTADDARPFFGTLSMHLIAFASIDPRLAGGLHIFECPMAEGFQKWFQPSPTLENPYMGQMMLTCGQASSWSDPEMVHEQHAHATTDGDEVAHYTCAMHPSVKQATPGNCPICGMALTPVTKAEAASGSILVDAIRRQRIGVRTEAAAMRDMTLHVRAVGAVKFDETRLADVNLRMGGWVRGLTVNQTGQKVAQGQKLFTLYSPELYAAQKEHLASSANPMPGIAEGVNVLAQASAQRLRLLGMSDQQIRELEKRGEVTEYVPIVSPAAGHVIEKNVVEGARVEAGMSVFRLADLSRVWIDAEVFESDLPHMRVGLAVTVDLPYAPGRTFEGKVDFIYPTLQGQTRTGRVRIVLGNRGMELRPDMYANVSLDVPLGKRLAVPETAVVYTGPRRLVFVDQGEGKLQPREVKLGALVDGYHEITEGIAAGDIVVTSGTFLIAAESRIRSASKYWEGEGAHAGH